ncbi:predicted protein [Lodderomyces elongisporus NRRL YB-4239]|uniref:Uncharacterized protein n=1 Tax=Lodderomyces elongisporus (strain ATCC 11503 / CBS 2605 / JCM 1781 / NBRC 1676 / NRRL YB-4239) TaxID=379508 RepID=A5DYL3_LODEL|nr:predicted protein [Lodderomyces elongisporus NRRL YB-4239]
MGNDGLTTDTILVFAFCFLLFAFLFLLFTVTNRCTYTSMVPTPPPPPSLGDSPISCSVAYSILLYCSQLIAYCLLLIVFFFFFFFFISSSCFSLYLSLTRMSSASDYSSPIFSYIFLLSLTFFYFILFFIFFYLFILTNIWKEEEFPKLIYLNYLIFQQQ